MFISNTFLCYLRQSITFQWYICHRVNRRVPGQQRNLETLLQEDRQILSSWIGWGAAPLYGITGESCCNYVLKKRLLCCTPDYTPACCRLMCCTPDNTLAYCRLYHLSFFPYWLADYSLICSDSVILQLALDYVLNLIKWFLRSMGLDVVRKLDLYKKVPHDLKKGTLSGAVISVLCVVTTS